MPFPHLVGVPSTQGSPRYGVDVPVGPLSLPRLRYPIDVVLVHKISELALLD